MRPRRLFVPVWGDEAPERCAFNGYSHSADAHNAISRVATFQRSKGEVAGTGIVEPFVSVRALLASMDVLLEKIRKDPLLKPPRVKRELLEQIRELKREIERFGS